MRIINLMEDTEGANGCIFEHGLSFYIETKKHKLLLDTGASGKTLKNAEMLGIDLTQVDTVILSHGHYDHSGGIMAFAEINPNAKIYLQRSARYDYYNLKDNKEKYIGIDKAILELPQVQLLDGNCSIDEELFLFTNVTGRKYWAKSNLLLKRKVEGEFVQDVFDHEQCLVITEEDKHVLLSGCAHNGILNILEAYNSYFDKQPSMVISGFHLIKKEAYDEEEIQMIQDTARELQKYHTMFYTGHCTGIPAYDIMKEIMQEKLVFVHSGMTVYEDKTCINGQNRTKTSC